MNLQQKGILLISMGASGGISLLFYRLNHDVALPLGVFFVIFNIIVYSLIVIFSVKKTQDETGTEMQITPTETAAQQTDTIKIESILNKITDYFINHTALAATIVYLIVMGSSIQGIINEGILSIYGFNIFCLTLIYFVSYVIIKRKLVGSWIAIITTIISIIIYLLYDNIETTTIQFLVVGSIIYLSCVIFINQFLLSSYLKSTKIMKIIILLFFPFLIPMIGIILTLLLGLIGGGYGALIAYIYISYAIVGIAIFYLILRLVSLGSRYVRQHLNKNERIITFIDGGFDRTNDLLNSYQPKYQREDKQINNFIDEKIEVQESLDSTSFNYIPTTNRPGFTIHDTFGSVLGHIYRIVFLGQSYRKEINGVEYVTGLSVISVFFIPTSIVHILFGFWSIARDHSFGFGYSYGIISSISTIIGILLILRLIKLHRNYYNKKSVRSNISIIWLINNLILAGLEGGGGRDGVGTMITYALINIGFNIWFLIYILISRNMQTKTNNKNTVSLKHYLHISILYIILFLVAIMVRTMIYDIL